MSETGTWIPSSSEPASEGSSTDTAHIANRQAQWAAVASERTLLVADLDSSPTFEDSAQPDHASIRTESAAVNPVSYTVSPGSSSARVESVSVKQPKEEEDAVVVEEVRVEDVRMLTSRQSNAGLVLMDTSKLQAVFVPCSETANGDLSFFTCNASLDEAAPDTIVVVFQDWVDAEALLRIISVMPGYTPHDDLQLQVIQMSPADVHQRYHALGDGDGKIVCFKKGFHKAARIRIGMDIADVSTIICGAHIASLVESQVHV